ncbi:hypothetical protein LCGC14_1529590 [marine sediment metagenome]|uniref:HNH nuclease domain-containing protein n=1 Tax=marine sediment metagenome TaxID=412755 RepID=A0A0F9JH04_9ZZZZ
MALWEVYNNRCFYCSYLIPSLDNLEVDHIIYKKIINNNKEYEKLKEELSLEENFDINDYNNLVPTHSNCNKRKRNHIYKKRTMLFYLEEAARRVPLVKEREQELRQTMDLSKLDTYAEISISKVNDLMILLGGKKNIMKYFEQAEVELSKDKRYNGRISSFSTESLFMEMDNPVNNRLLSSQLYLKKIKIPDRKKALGLIDNMLLYCNRRPHAIFRVSTLHILLSLYEERPEIFSSSDINYFKDGIENIALCNLNYWSHDNIQNALCHYENITLRLSKLFSLKFYLENAKNARVLLNEKIEKMTGKKPAFTSDVAELLLYFIQFFASYYWEDFVESTTSRKIWQGFWLYQHAIELLSSLSIPFYPEGSGDLTNFENYGGTFDMYIYGTWDVLRKHNKILSDFNPKLLEFSKLSHKDVRLRIPRWKDRPQEWIPPLKQYEDKRIVKLIKLLEEMK